MAYLDEHGLQRVWNKMKAWVNPFVASFLGDDYDTTKGTVEQRLSAIESALVSLNTLLFAYGDIQTLQNWTASRYDFGNHRWNIPYGMSFFLSLQEGSKMVFWFGTKWCEADGTTVYTPDVPTPPSDES